MQPEKTESYVEQLKTVRMPAGWKITDEKLKEKLVAMNRAQRRAWAARPENRRGR